jgi:branched-chain amino acid aminotransferase
VLSFHQTQNGSAVFRLDRHLQRLRRTLDLIDLELAQTDDQITAAVMETIKANQVEKGFIKILAFIGRTALAILPPDGPLDLAVYADDPGTLGFEPGQTTSVCFPSWRKLSPVSVPVEAKAAANYLNGMLARREAVRRGFDHAVMLDHHGLLAEGGTESVFMVEKGRLVTPPLGSILRSISRDSVLQLAENDGIPTAEEPISPDRLKAADEMFTAGTPFKVLPAGRIEDRVFDDAPGPITRRLFDLMERAVTGRHPDFERWLFHVK